MQSANNQDLSDLEKSTGSHAFGGPAFLWVRGQRCWIQRLTDAASADMPPETVRSQEVPADPGAAWLLVEGGGDAYEPLREVPKLYLEFAALGEELKGPSEVHDSWTAEAVRFVQRYGLPMGEASIDPESIITHPEWSKPGGVKLLSFYHAAVDLNLSVSLLIAAFRAEERNDDSLLREHPVRDVVFEAAEKSGERVARIAKLFFAAQIRHQLAGKVHLVPGVFPDSTRITPGYTCDTLLTAMWLQLYEAAVAGRLLKPQCLNCNRPFEAKDRRQQYCDSFCRHAANQRAYYARHKKEKELS